MFGKVWSNPVEIEVLPEDPVVPRKFLEGFLEAVAARNNARGGRDD
jgi:hypothetical protein